MKDELEGVELDNAVALALGHKLVGHEIHDAKTGHLVERTDYSTDWAHGGWIIERERISVAFPEKLPQSGYAWHANIAREEASWNAYGPTPLIAAMRAFVAWHKGTTCREWDARP